MKVFLGKVISVKMAKTATVSVERFITHPLYKKRIKKVKKYQIHDEIGSKVGDWVKFRPSKPFSKTKKWVLIGIVNKDQKKSKKKISKRIRKE